MIFGAGSIGSLFGGYLALQTEHEVILIGREHHVDEIKENGLLITGVHGEFRVDNIQAETEISDIEDIDVVFITTKAYDTEDAAISIKDNVSEKTMIISLQNGLGIEEIIEQNIQKTNKIFRATTTNGALMKKPGHVIHTGFGNLIIGSILNQHQAELNVISGLLRDSGFNPGITDDIKQVIWKKIMVNVGINPLGTLLNIPNGMIPEKISESMMKKILNEAVMVAEKEGVSITLQEAYESVIEVCNNTKNNRNSMLQDIDKEKRTEIDYINGAIVSIAKKHDLQVPYNELITSLIKGIENTI